MPNASIILTEPREPALRPLARRTIGDDALDTLRKAIIAGAYAPGDHLAESTLAQQMGVSRAPVREAMMQLEREGLLVFNKRGAALVKEFTTDDFEEIYSLRLTLEMMAARLACRNLAPVPAALLANNIERTRAAKRLLDLTLLDVEFHDLVVQAARHQRLYAAWSNLRHQIEVWLARMQSRLDAPVQKTRAATVEHHLGILKALRSQKEDQATRVIREHIEGWRRQFPKANPGL